MMTETSWSVPVRPEEIPEAGKQVILEANETERAALAVPAGVDAIERLTATFDLMRSGLDGLHVSGRVMAVVRQTCVVSLEPVTNEIDEDVEVTFAPAADAEPAQETPQGTLTEGPEPLVGGAVDLAALALEFLILGVDPHPRKAGAVFAQAPADASAHPFAGLAALAKKGTVKD